MFGFGAVVFLLAAFVLGFGNAWLTFLGGTTSATPVGTERTLRGGSVTHYEFEVRGETYSVQSSGPVERAPRVDYLPQNPNVARLRSSAGFGYFVAGFLGFLGFGCVMSVRERRRDEARFRALGPHVHSESAAPHRRQ